MGNIGLGNTLVSHENGGYERIRPHQTAFDALGIRDYIGGIPERERYIQESPFDLGNPGLTT